MRKLGDKSKSKRGSQKTEKPSATIQNLAKLNTLITGQKQDGLSSVEEYVQEICIFYQSILANMPNHVYWLDRNCVLRGGNNNLAHFFGLKTASELAGLTYKEMGKLANWTEGQGQSFKEAELEVMSTGVPRFNVEEPAVFVNDQAKYYISSKVPLYNKNNEIIGVLGISTDVTDLKEAKEKAEAASKAKTEFLANMSHDIRTPLTGVIGLSQSLEDDLDNPSLKEDARMLYDCGQELLSMLNDILDTVQVGDIGKEDINEETFNIYECIVDLVKLEKPTTALKKLDLLINIEPNVSPCIVSDRKKIHRILLNLISNAVKFTKTGHITIGVKCLEEKGDDTHLQFSVADTGIGIPKDLQDKVFERFFRVSPSYKGIYRGHGLGLNIVQSYVTLLGGKVTLTSEEGVGTTFFFDIWCKKGIPENQEEKQASESANSISELLAVHSAQPKASKVPAIQSLENIDSDAPYLLLIEDNDGALKVLSSFVKKLGCRIEAASNAEDAFELFITKSFDLVISDIGLPGMSGYEMTAKIRGWETEQGKLPVPVVALTGHGEQAVRKECLEAGMNGILTKPADINTLKSLLNQYVINKEKPAEKRNEISKSVVGLGLDLPNTEPELFKLDGHLLFNAKLALAQLGDSTILIEMLKDFISDICQVDIKNIEKAYAIKEWATIEKLAHKIKGGAVYMGIERMKYACQYMERYVKAGHTTRLDELYYQLIKVNEQTIEEITVWLSKYDF